MVVPTRLSGDKKPKGTGKKTKNIALVQMIRNTLESYSIFCHLLQSLLHFGILIPPCSLFTHLLSWQGERGIVYQGIGATG